MQEITSAGNPRIKLARKLQRRRAREQTGLCLLEGVRLVADAWAADAYFDAIFVTRHLWDQRASLPLLASLERAAAPLFLISQELMAEISETVAPQGIAALCHMPRLSIPTNPWLVLVLDGVGDPGNAGTLLRSAAAAGAERVIFAPETVDPFSPKVLRAGMGAHFRVAVSQAESWDEVVTGLGAGRRLYTADAGARLLYTDVNWRLPSALVVGSESHGPSRAALAASTPVAIPMRAGIESLNAGVAGSVVLFEAARQRRAIGKD